MHCLLPRMSAFDPGTPVCAVPCEEVATAEREASKELMFFNRDATLGALLSFQVGVFGFLIGYSTYGLEGGTLGWILGLAIGLVARCLFVKP